MTVSGAGIVAETYVTTVINDTTAILSAPSSFPGNNRTLTFAETLTDSSPPIPMKAAPKGMYIFTSGWLSATKQAVNQAGTAISNANCDGVRWNARWADIEATPNNYTWQYLDDAVAWAATNNKTCGIHINAGMDSPAWLYAAPYNAQSYTLVDTVVVDHVPVGAKIPIPGDTVFMTRWQKFVTDLGAQQQMMAYPIRPAH